MKVTINRRFFDNSRTGLFALEGIVRFAYEPSNSESRPEIILVYGLDTLSVPKEHTNLLNFECELKKEQNIISLNYKNATAVLATIAEDNKYRVEHGSEVSNLEALCIDTNLKQGLAIQLNRKVLSNAQGLFTLRKTPTRVALVKKDDELPEYVFAYSSYLIPLACDEPELYELGDKRLTRHGVISCENATIILAPRKSNDMWREEHVGKIDKYELFCIEAE